MRKISRRSLMATGIFAIPAIASAKSSGEKNWFQLKNVTIDAVDENARTVSMTLGKLAHSMELKGVPVTKNVQVRVSMKLPGVVNNLPFTWNRVRELVGTLVSVQFEFTDEQLLLSTIAAAND